MCSSEHDGQVPLSQAVDRSDATFAGPGGTSRPPRRSNADRSAATRLKLLDATIESLSDLGWARTTTTEVVRRAGVSRGAQVHHFPTKEDLVLAAVYHLLERRSEEFAEAFAELPAERRSPAAAIRILHERCFGPSFDAWLELALAARTDPTLHERFIAVETRFWTATTEAFRELFPELTGGGDDDVRIGLQLTFALLDGLAVQRLTDADPKELDDVIDAFVLMLEPLLPSADTPEIDIGPPDAPTSPKGVQP
jgi:AcrR family transcriptional regulator